MDKPLSSFADGWLIVIIACQYDREKKNRNRQQKKAVRGYGGKEMKEHFVTEEAITAFVQYLRQEEREAATIEKYSRQVRTFYRWLQGRAVTKETVLEWKGDLQKEGYAPGTVNGKLSAMNSFFRFVGWEECRVKFLRIQRQMFRQQSKELTRAEYTRLLDAAHRNGKERLELLMGTICSAGIRVGELPFITVEAARAGRAEVALKGKIRVILLPDRLCRKLLKFAKKQGIDAGEIFVTKNGKGLSRRQIWREMKELCRAAGVESSKVFPHNLRHLFATTFYKICGDIVKLADVLGHSSVETTRIYLLTAGREHARQMELTGLIL